MKSNCCNIIVLSVLEAQASQAERSLWQELYLILQSSQQKANVKLRERMRKCCRFRINTGNTGLLVASYTGRSSSRDCGSILWAPRAIIEERCPMGHEVKSKNVATLEQSFVNENNFKCVQRGRNKKVNWLVSSAINHVLIWTGKLTQSFI